MRRLSMKLRRMGCRRLTSTVTSLSSLQRTRTDSLKSTKGSKHSYRLILFWTARSNLCQHHKCRLWGSKCNLLLQRRCLLRIQEEATKRFPKRVFWPQPLRSSSFHQSLRLSQQNYRLLLCNLSNKPFRWLAAQAALKSFPLSTDLKLGIRLMSSLTLTISRLTWRNRLVTRWTLSS